jgi:hypothetical protein
MSATPRRKRLCRTSSLASREFVYQTADGIEVDTAEQFDLVRRRVLFEDVRLVTFHRRRGFAFLLVTGLFAGFFIFFGGLIASLGGNGSFEGAATFFAMAAPFLIAFFLRVIFGVDVITVFGRRSKAVIRFSFRKQRARTLYGEICAAARAAQRVRPATMPGANANPLASEVPMPPQSEATPLDSAPPPRVPTDV